MIIQVNDNFSLTPINKNDKPDLVKQINHPNISNNTLTIPYPYTPKDADLYYTLIKGKEAKLGMQSEWTIRNKEEKLIGGIGLLRKAFFGNPHRDAFGYWIGESYWGKGIMTDIVRTFSDYCLHQENIVRLEATVFQYNPASMRVLEKAGFQREGYLRKALLKEGKYLDCVLYAKIKD